MSWEGFGDTIHFCELEVCLLMFEADLNLSYRLDVGNVGGAIRGFLS